MSITFTRTTQTHDAATGTMTSATSTVVGSAIRVQPRSIFEWEMYKELSLTEAEAPLLFFTPNAYGEVPKPGDVVTWPETDGTVYTVRRVSPLAPDGVVIAARVLVSR